MDRKKNKTHDYQKKTYEHSEGSSSECFGDLQDEEADDYLEPAVQWDAEPGSKSESKAADGPKNITVKHYLVNLESISYINRIKYI